MINEPKSRHPLARLIRYTRHHRRRVFAASLFSVLNKLFDLAPPALIGVAVDTVVQREDSFLASFGVSSVSDQLVVLGLLTLIIWLLESLFEYLNRIVWRDLAQIIEHDLRVDAYSHVQDLELAYFEDRSTGELMAIINDDINQLERFLDIGANQLIQITTTVIVIGAMFIIIAPEVAWMGMAPMPVIIWGSVKFQKLLTERYTDVRQRVGALNSMLSNNLSGIVTIKSFTAERFETSRIHDESMRYRRANERAIRLSSAFSPLIRIAIVMGFIAILIFGGRMTIDGDLSVGVYSVMIFMVQRLLWPLTALGETFDQYQRAMASTTRILNVLDTQPKISSGKTPLNLHDARGAIRFDNVSFAYANGFQTLSGLSLDIAAGESVALVGATGAGKSTILKLLMRFYDPQEGVITFDGHPLKDLRLPDLRRVIGLVSQDVFLFHGAVRDNIAYGKPDATLDEIVAAAKIAEAHSFIEDLPQGYDTIVGERGQKLSGGQRQRISIARAILNDPPVLVLDEATSSVDNETEAAIQRSLEKIIHQRTTIIIAHRLSTVRNADQIYVLENGSIKEQGRHDQLAHGDGIYAQLWRVQTGVGARLAGD